MKKILWQILILLGLLLMLFLSFSTLMPIVKSSSEEIPKTEFSVYRAFEHVKKISEKPHFVGSEEHAKVRTYIVNEFQKLGLSVHTQNGYVVNDYKILTNPTNIIAVLEGIDPQPKSDLLVMAHYDSDPHSSHGAGDDAAGIAAILESLRLYVHQNEAPKNNVIFLISDAEEIGLLGAKLFVEKHPLVENIGLVLNFEARGTSGPSNAILESNYGNKKLVEAFGKARVQYPMASSMEYEIYKNMPNDTDATVFREEKNISSFFFAFIDGHYNYHAATDNAANLNINSLAHQGSYLNALLPYFADADLSSFETSKNKIFFDFPVFKLIHYDYIWIFPLLFAGWILFVVLLIYGIRKQRFSVKEVYKAYLPFAISLVVVMVLGVLGWKLILALYPQYFEILQGYPYNGHLYVAAFVLFSLSLLFLIYSYFWKSSRQIAIFIAPLSFWLILLTLLSFFFKGATYFIFPVLFFELLLFLMIWKVNFPDVLKLFFIIPAVFIFSPLVLFIPVALGLNNVFAGLLILLLEIFLILPVFSGFKHKKLMALALSLFGIYFIIQAHSEAEFSPERPKPNSLVYVADLDQQQASWNTYDHILDEWTQPFFTDSSETIQTDFDLGSKYGNTFTYMQKADFKNIPGVDYVVLKDSLNDSYTHFTIKINPKRNLHRLNLYSEAMRDFEDFKANDLTVETSPQGKSKMRKTSARDTRLLTYYPVDADTLTLRFKLPNHLENPRLEIFSASHDLLDNEWMKVPSRTAQMMPKPFVLNDAVITRQRIKL